MNTRRLMAALGFALFCSAVLSWQLSKHLSPPPAPAPAVPMHAVVLAARNIMAGESLTASALTVVSWPASQQIAGSFSNTKALVGHALAMPVAAGELILKHDLALPGTDDGVTGIVPPGLRAIAARGIDEGSVISGLLTSGSHVDVFVSYRSGTNGDFISSLVLQNVRVLATGGKGSSGPQTRLYSEDSLMLLVTPEEAARLTAANALGKLTVAVRNDTDMALTPGLSRVSLAADRGRQTPLPLSEGHSAAMAQKMPRKNFTMETLAGNKSTLQTFEEEQP